MRYIIHFNLTLCTNARCLFFFSIDIFFFCSLFSFFSLIIVFSIYSFFSALSFYSILSYIEIRSIVLVAFFGRSAKTTLLVILFMISSRYNPPRILIATHSFEKTRPKLKVFKKIKTGHLNLTSSYYINRFSESK